MKTITNKTPFSDLIDPLRKCLDYFYTLKRTSKLSFDYESYGGYGLHFSVGATNIIDFSREGLQYEKEQGRKPIDVILRVAFQLGYSRAQVELHEMNELLMKTNELLIKNIKELKEVISRYEAEEYNRQQSL